MTQELIKTDICVIGAGSGGLSVAAGAAQMGVDVTLVEADKMGGDCLNHGCVPSKSMLAAAHLNHAANDAQNLGLDAHSKARFESVMAHIADVIAQIEPHDSEERFVGLGVRVIRGRAYFADRRHIKVDNRMIRAKRFVIASGAKPAIPPIVGLSDCPYLTNETVFSQKTCPAHLLVLGGGAIGVEMAQAHRRLGARVTIIEADSLLNREDKDAVAVVRRQLRADGITLYEQTRVEKIAKTADGISAVIDGDVLEASHILVATGRKANIEDMGLAEAGVRVGGVGIKVDARLRTHNRRIYAIGDAIGGAQFTHVAGYHAGVVIRNILFHLPAKAQTTLIPRVTYCAPELAQIGITQAEAERDGQKVQCVKWGFDENDRARTERDIAGFAKIVTGKRGRILGATIVGRGAGDLLAPWILAMDRGLSIGAMTRPILPYPTRSEISKRVAGAYYTPTLFSRRTRFIVWLLGLLRF